MNNVTPHPSTDPALFLITEIQQLAHALEGLVKVVREMNAEIADLRRQVEGR